MRDADVVERVIAYREQHGELDPGCPGCVEWYEKLRAGMPVFAPRHVASRLCRSGKRPHCSCACCF